MRYSQGVNRPVEVTHRAGSFSATTISRSTGFSASFDGKGKISSTPCCPMIIVNPIPPKLRITCQFRAHCRRQTGLMGRPAIIRDRDTLVERHTRYVMLFPLPEGTHRRSSPQPVWLATVQRTPLRRPLAVPHLGSGQAEMAQITTNSTGSHHRSAKCISVITKSLLAAGNLTRIPTDSLTSILSLTGTDIQPQRLTPVMATSTRRLSSRLWCLQLAEASCLDLCNA